MNETSLQVVPSSNTTELMTFRDPKAVLTEATKAAMALRDLITKKPNPVIFNKQQYLEYEDWQLLGQFCGGIKAKVTWTRFLDMGGGLKGFEAGADAIDAEGRVISSAEAMCLNDEENWGLRPKYEYMDTVGAEKQGLKIVRKYDKGRCQVKIGEVAVPMFQLRSMAQTRACAKALNNCLRWVAVLADFAPTPAEEMTGERDHDEKPTIKPPQQKAAHPQSAGEPPLIPNDRIRYLLDVQEAEGVNKETKKPWKRYDCYFEGDSNKYSTFSESLAMVATAALRDGDGVIVDVKATQSGKYTNWTLEHIEIVPGTKRAAEPEKEAAPF